MIEFYVAATLIGVGYIINKRITSVSNDNTSNQPKLKAAEIPSQKTVYESTYFDKVKQIEESKAKALFLENAIKKSKLKNESVSNNFNKQPERYISQLSGQPTDFKHSNMDPFYRGSVKQNIVKSSPIVEKFTGMSDLYKSKEVIAPMFVPEKNIITGLPVNTDLYQKRFNKPIIHNNVVPIPQIKVGKGVGQGFTSMPTGGFHQFDERDYVMPKTVDDLRVASNPKSIYEGRIIEGQKPTKRAAKPNLVKNRSETFYNNSEERYFTTTGAYVKPTEQPEFEVKYTSRPETSTQYTGVACLKVKDGERPAELAPYETLKQQLSEYGITNATASYIGKGEQFDHGKDGILVYGNERDLTVEKTYQGNIASLVKALVAPVQDMFRTSKKELLIANARENGELQALAQGPEKPSLQYTDVAKTTIKETLLQDSEKVNLKGQVKTTVYDPNNIARTTIKETLLNSSEVINLTGPSKNIVYDPNSIAKTTIKETLLTETELMNIDARRNAGISRVPGEKATTTVRETLDNIDTTINMAVSKYTSIVKDPKDIARTTIKETIAESNRGDGNIIKVEQTQGGYKIASYEMKDTNQQYLSQNEYNGNITVCKADGYKVAPTDLKPTQKELLSDNEYYGGIADQTHKEFMSYEYMYNAAIDSLKEDLEEGRDPTQTGVKVASGSDFVNIENTKKSELDFDFFESNIDITTKTNKNQIPLYTQPTSVTKDRFDYDYNHENDRFDTEILSALKDNPYVQNILKHS